MPGPHDLRDGSLRAATRWLPLAAALSILTGLSCFNEVSRPQIQPTAQLALAPVFSTSATAIVDFDRVRIVCTQASTDAVAYDRVVSFPANEDTIVLQVALPVSGVSRAEVYILDLAMIDAAGDTVFRGGPSQIAVTAGATAQPLEVPIRYTGTGANAAAVRITSPDTSIFFGDSVRLTAEALDSAGAPIPGTPVEWTSLDSARARVPSSRVGTVIALTQRGPARIRARLVTGQVDTAVVRVQPVASALALASGSGQSGSVGDTLPQPLAVRVTAADGLGVAGIAVRFSVTAGSGLVDSIAATDTAGYARAQLRLGTASGTTTVSASVAGLAGSPVTFTATAVAGAAALLQVTGQPGTSQAGQPISPAIVIRARDAFGNTAPTFGGTVTLALVQNPGDAVLSGTTALAAVAGVATFANVVLDRPASGYVLEATATGLTPATTDTFTVTAGAASTIAINTGDGQSATVNTAVATPPSVVVTDALGNPVAGVSVTFAVATGGGTVVPTTPVTTNVSGIATVTSWTLGTTAGANTLTATSAGLTGSPVTFTATGTAAAAGTIALNAGDGQSATVNTAVATPPSVIVKDALGNPVAGVSVTFAVATGGGAVVPTTAVITNASGIAAAMSWTLGRTAGANTLTATATGLTGSPVTFTATGTAGAAVQILFSLQPPDTAVAGAPFVVAVSARDALGNIADAAVGSVTLSMSVSPTGDTLAGATTQPLSSGVASFTGLTVSLVGSGYVIGAAYDTMTAVSTSFTVRSAPAAALVLISGDAQTDSAGATLAQPLVVQLRDAWGNGVAGDTVTFAPVAGTAAPLTAVTDANGHAQTTWTLGTTAGPQSVVASRTGLPSVTFTATATAAAPAALQFVSQPTNTPAGHVIAPPVTVRVRDQYGNTVTTATDTVYLGLNIDMALYGTTMAGAVGGVATFSDLTVHGAYSAYRIMAGTVGQLAPDSSAPFAITAGTPATLSLVSGDGQSGAASAPLTAPLVVLVQDSFANVVPGFVVNWAVISGGGSLPATSVTDSFGLAQATWVLGALTGTQAAEASAAGLVGSPVPFSASAAPAGVTAVWTGSVSSDWSTTGNWAASVVPGPSDTVYIPASAPQQPTLATATVIGGLLMGSGASLTIDTLQGLGILGNADASFTSVGGAGTVILAGSGTVRGRFRGLLVQGSYTIRDSIITSGELFLAGTGANLGGNGGYARVGGDLAVTGNATLTMAAGDSIDVLGSATFAGASEAGRLTGGTLRVAGDFVQAPATSTESFVGGPNHRLVLNGTGPQTVSMASAVAASPSIIGDLIVANTADTVHFNLAALIADRFEIPTGAHVDAADTLKVDGTTDGLHLAAGASLVAPTLVLAGPTVIDPTATYQVANTMFAGAGPQDIPALASYDTLTALGTGRLTGATSAGVLAVGDGATAASLRIPASTQLAIAIAGTVQPAATLIVAGGMVTGAGSLTVSGTLDFRAGTLAGTGITQIQSGAQMLVDSAATTISGRLLRNAGAVLWTAVPAMTIAPPTGVDTAVIIQNQVGGNLSYTGTGAGGIVVSGVAPQITNAGTITFNSTSSFSIYPYLTHTGTFDISGTNGRLQLFGGATLLSGGTIATGAQLALNQFVYDLGGSVVFSGTGILAVGNSALLNLGGHRLTLGGGFSTLGGGSFTMLSRADTLVVPGTFNANGGATAGSLTDGVLFLGGDVNQLTTGVSATSFAPSGSHLTVLNGTGAQLITLNQADSLTGSRFNNLRLDNTAGTVSFATRAFVEGVFSTPDTVVARKLAGFLANQTLYVRGINAGNLVFDNLDLFVRDGQPITMLSTATFQNMSATANHLTFTRAAGTFQFSGVNFASTPNTGFYNLVVNNTQIGAALILSFTNSLPDYNTMAGSPARYLLTGATTPVVNWNGSQLQ